MNEREENRGLDLIWAGIKHSWIDYEIDCDRVFELPLKISKLRELFETFLDEHSSSIALIWLLHM